MFDEDTIAALSTPPGYSGIGIVRLSGGNAIEIADRVFLSPGKKMLRHTPSHRILYGHIVNPADSEIMDEVLVSVMKAPHTYTREDIVEINCHGGPLTIRKVLHLLLEQGARLAEPGEFTRRAFINGRIDLAQSEAVLDIIHALTERGHRASMRQLSGGLSEKIDLLRKKIVGLSAVIETYIDFPGEGISPPDLKDMGSTASGIKQDLHRLIERAGYGRILREGLRTAIIGRPNVGKSSLLNALLDRERVIVTEMPGTTRDVIEEYLDINGVPVLIMDTAGIREARDVAEREGVERSMRAMKEASLVLLVIDGSEELHDTDRELITRSLAKNTILVINKSDLASLVKDDGMPSGSPVVRISATTGTGLDALKKMIVEKSLGGEALSGEVIVTNIRHVRSLERAYSSLCAFIDRLPDLSPEFLAVELRESLDALGEIVGSTTPEEILNRIFSDFCIGK
jgi:tRNA modification GTPase